MAAHGLKPEPSVRGLVTNLLPAGKPCHPYPSAFRLQQGVCLVHIACSAQATKTRLGCAVDRHGRKSQVRIRTPLAESALQRTHALTMLLLPFLVPFRGTILYSGLTNSAAKDSDLPFPAFAGLHNLVLQRTGYFCPAPSI